jgi:hypothetical protein
MSIRLDRAVHGPGWGEVILGAVLSLVLGAALGAVLLIIRPVHTVRELPKEEDRVRDAVYYVEGSRITARATQAPAKRRAFVAGQSITATEDEINSLITVAPSAAEKPGAEPAAAGMIAVGTPNVRILDGKVQVGAPVTLNVLGLSQKVVLQARGGFVKEEDRFVYEPDEMYLGSCPVQRVPILSGYVRQRIMESHPIPEDIATAWQRLTNVAVEGKALRLSMP